MTRVSLKEAYDNKDVIAQIYAIRDTAESAVDTSEQAVTTANTASDHVDALVPQVEGAVENANSASASAQASAQTVAGYENRLATAEDKISALETADQLNLKTVGTQNFTGLKTSLSYPVRNQTVTAQAEDGWHLMYSWNAGSTTANQLILFAVRYKQLTNGFGLLLVDIRSTNATAVWLIKGQGVPDDSIIVARDYTTSTAYLFINGYRLETECFGCSRATSTSPVEVIRSETAETAVAEPTTDNYDSVVKI